MTQRDDARDRTGSSAVVRPATEQDAERIRALFDAGRLVDPVDESDAAEDLRNLKETYLPEDGSSGFWVAESGEGELIGMIGVCHAGNSTAQIRRLRVDTEWRGRGVGGDLVKHALGFCSDHGYVKIILRAQVDQEAAIALFRRFGFQLSRTRVVDGVERLEFYMDLYREPEERTS